MVQKTVTLNMPYHTQMQMLITKTVPLLPCFLSFGLSTLYQLIMKLSQIYACPNEGVARLGYPFMEPFSPIVLGQACFKIVSQT